MSTRFALDMAEREGTPALALQHHFAHAHAVLAEHGHGGPAVVLALDGAGYGGDGTVWGGECLYVDTITLAHRRCGHLAPVSLPGGEAAIREPWRMAASYLTALGVLDPILPEWRKAFPHASALLPRMLDKGVNCPATTSCGRLFDAVAALLGLRLAVEQEAEAAMLLERAQDVTETGRYACPLRRETDPVVLDTLALFRQCLEDHESGAPAGIVSRRFHLGLAQGLADLAAHACGQGKTGVVGAFRGRPAEPHPGPRVARGFGGPGAPLPVPPEPASGRPLRLPGTGRLGAGPARPWNAVTGIQWNGRPGENGGPAPFFTTRCYGNILI